MYLHNFQCGFHNCYGQKKGFLKQDGSLNVEGLLTEYYEDFYQQPELFERIQKRCIFGNLSRFGNSCDAEKLKKCVYPFMLMVSQNLSQTGILVESFVVSFLI